MKARAIVPLVIGLGIGLIAIKLVVDVVQRAQGSAGKSDTVPVIVAKSEIPVGSEITETMIKVAETPKSLVPAQHFESVEKLVGRVNRFSILPGVVVQPMMLSPEGTASGLSVKIPEGFRAVAVKVDEFSSVGGFLKPGSHVDVIAVMTVKKNGRTDTITKIILQNIEVAAVGQQLDQNTEGTNSLTRSVTLLVRPREASQLHLAATKGNIRLAMRNQKDKIASDTEDARESEMLDDDSQKKHESLGFLQTLMAAAATAKAEKTAEDESTQLATNQAKTWTVTQIRGNQTQTTVFASPDSWVRVDGSDSMIGRTPPRMPMSTPSVRPPFGTRHQPAPDADVPNHDDDGPLVGE